MLLDSLGIEERLPSQEGQRAASRRVVNWVEEVDCVKLVCEGRRLVVLAFWNQLRIAHRSPLREGSVVRYPRCYLTPATSFHSIKDFGRFLFVPVPKTIWFLVKTSLGFFCDS